MTTRFSTLDGYTFTIMPDGSVTDGDMEWATVAEALHDLADLLAPDQLCALRTLHPDRSHHTMDTLPASLTDYAANHETYGAAIYAARKAGLVLCKHADPTEGERRDLTDEEAADIAREDIGLLYVDRA
jgi:hypothetical protein